MSSILFILSGAPHGSINAQESLDALLMGSAFTQCSALFLGQGILQLVSHQETDDLGVKNFALGFKPLDEYGVKRITCSVGDLQQLGLSTDDLMIGIETLDDMAMRQIIKDHDKVLNF